jgi:hypothetical protein
MEGKGRRRKWEGYGISKYHNNLPTKAGKSLLFSLKY